MTTLYNKISSIILFSASLLTLSSCYTDFEPKLKSTPVVCINSLITAGEQIRVEVTRTWRYSEGNPADKLDIILRDAEVFLYVNDEMQEKLVFTTKIGSYAWEVYNYFESKYIPKSGDNIKIKAIDKTYGEAIAEVNMPFPVEIESVETKVTNNESSVDLEENTFKSDFDMIIEVTLRDPESDSNYYIFDMQQNKTLRYESEDSSYIPRAEYYHITPDYTYEPIFSEHISPLETIITDAYGLYTVFSDRQISGASYTLEIPVKGRYECDYNNHPDLDNKLTLDVKLGHISTSYYNYMLSLWAATEGISGALGDVGLGDAVFEFSNVSTGAGIVAARANSIAKLNIHDILNKDE